MQLGENPRKVSNIVSAQFDEFRRLYKPLLDSFQKHVTRLSPESRQFAQDVSPRSRAYVLGRLPLHLRDKVRAYYERKWNLEAAGVATKSAAEIGGLVETTPTTPSEAEEALWMKIVSDDEFHRVLDKSERRLLALLHPVLLY
jgi:translocator assembly and maintenance protein 41